jgi:hypothetical protein
MTTDSRLENYLSRLDKALAKISIGDRADIITEIKSHVLSAQERDPSRDLNQILEALGEPESVANRYLLERGLQPGKPSKTPIVKWLSIGLLGSVAAFVILVIFLVSFFSPLIDVNEKENSVKILGGLIHVDGAKSSVDLAGTAIRQYEGSLTFGAATKSLDVDFSNGEINIYASQNNEFKWNCKVVGGAGEAIEAGKDGPTQENDRAFFDFSEANSAKCDLWLPANLALNIDGANGQLSINEPRAKVHLQLDNGDVRIQPVKNLEYAYDFRLVNGSVEPYKSSASPNAIQISAELTNGKISFKN